MDEQFKGTIENWTAYRDPYSAPEVPLRIQGVFQGKGIRTSYLKKTEGNFIFTISGSCYRLGKPHPEYLEWLLDNDYPFDSENPIRIVEELTELPPPTPKNKNTN